MAKVIERHGHSVDDKGFIHYDESPSTYEAAEKIAGFKLDRRKNYAIIDGQVCESAEWTQACSGCNAEWEERGSGCAECGYTGLSRQSHWVPVSEYDIDD